MVVLDNEISDFRNLDIYPTLEEILGARESIRKNITIGKFKDVNEYLDIQFRLLREDFVANLREAIETYRSNETTKNLTIYKNIILRLFYLSNEDNLIIDIKTEREDKTFMIGSLLLFTSNKFTNLFLAKVLNKCSDKGYIVIELINIKTCDINLNEVYIMAECSKYFDPYYNVLNALRNISIENFPMEKYIIHVDNSVYMPKYLVNSTHHYVIDGFKIPPQSLPQISTNLLGLNSAQFKAFKAALTQEFVVIQGPPGTGKTHLGIKIVSTFIQNFQFWYKNTPLLIISCKNDALDQFLEGLIPITDRLVRVGGQSKSEKLKTYNLSNEKSSNGFKKRSRVDYLRVMQQSLVVGMTSSIAARWKNFLVQLKSPIVIVEEAAEVLEAHVVAALTNNCQHLILMGDHQQLQPLSADYNISKNFQLEVSLFERMVMNNIQHYQLNIQHRMRPEIANLLKLKIYPFLLDHESVENRPDILGMMKNLYFFDHNYPEETCNFTTKKNCFEAKFLLFLSRYLVLNGYKVEDIVILATYAAQVQEIENLVKNDDLIGKIKISSLDGFQGQEAEIVLLSLVRSESIGFLGKENRVCVGLSRARSGFYIVGNMRLLAQNSKLWVGIRNYLKQIRSISDKFPLKCLNHGSITYVKNLDDFWKVQNGGCCRKCEHLLICGHKCSFLCHSNKMEHKCENGCNELNTGSQGLMDNSYLERNSHSGEELLEANEDCNFFNMILTVIRTLRDFIVNVFLDFF